MNEFSKIDIDEKQFYSDYPKLLDLLLFDNTSQNIIWATDLYSKKGSGYKFNDPIYSYQIVNSKGFVIKPRSKKANWNKQKEVKIMLKFSRLLGFVINKITQLMRAGLDIKMLLILRKMNLGKLKMIQLNF